MGFPPVSLGRRLHLPCALEVLTLPGMPFQPLLVWRCQSWVELPKGWCYLRGRKGPVLSFKGWTRCGERLGSLLSYSQSCRSCWTLWAQCFIPQLGNIQIKIRLYSTVEELKSTGLLPLLFFLFPSPDEGVLCRALQCTSACTTEMFTSFLSFCKQLLKMQFCA